MWNLTVVDVCIEGRCTAYFCLGFQLLISVGVAIAMNLADLQMYTEFEESERDLSNNVHYFGSACALIAACLAPLLDLLLELIDMYRSRRSKSVSRREVLPFDSFLMQRLVVLLTILLPAVLFTADVHRFSSDYDAMVMSYYQYMITGAALVSVMRALNPVLFNYKTVAILLLLLNTSSTYAALVGRNMTHLAISSALVLYLMFVFTKAVKIYWNDDRSDLAASFKNSATVWYCSFAIGYYVVARAVGTMVDVSENNLVYKNLVKVGFITLFFVVRYYVLSIYLYTATPNHNGRGFNCGC